MTPTPISEALAQSEGAAFGPGAREPNPQAVSAVPASPPNAFLADALTKARMSLSQAAEWFGVYADEHDAKALGAFVPSEIKDRLAKGKRNRDRASELWLAVIAADDALRLAQGMAAPAGGETVGLDPKGNSPVGLADAPNPGPVEGEAPLPSTVERVAKALYAQACSFYGMGQLSFDALSEKGKQSWLGQANAAIAALSQADNRPEPRPNPSVRPGAKLSDGGLA
jgi:hypothetical protein